MVVCEIHSAALLQVWFSSIHSDDNKWELSQGSNYFHLVKEGCTSHRCLLAFSTLNGQSPTGSMVGLFTQEGETSLRAHFLSHLILMPWRTCPFQHALDSIVYLEKKFDAGICCPFYHKQPESADGRLPWTLKSVVQDQRPLVFNFKLKKAPECSSFASQFLTFHLFFS